MTDQPRDENGQYRPATVEEGHANAVLAALSQKPNLATRILGAVPRVDPLKGLERQTERGQPFTLPGATSFH